MAEILIVEDETAINELLRRNLELVGHRCRSVYDGKAAVEVLEEQAFDLMLLDIMLPGLDGFEVYREAGEIPTIFLTAKGGLTDRVKGLRMGADDYMVKPFEMLELLVRMEKVLKRRQDGQSFIRIRNVTVYPEKRVVEKDGKEVPFTPMEFDCLLLLLEHRNRPVTREQLLAKLWGVDFDGETRTIDVHIGRIRRKLDFGDVIRTIPRIGYRLEF